MMGPVSTRVALSVVLVALVVANLLANRIAPEAQFVVAAALVVVLAAVARASGLTAADLGLARSTWPAGLRVGLAWSGVVAAGYAVAYLTPPLADRVSALTDARWPEVLAEGLLIIPLATVIPEELAFRGVLLALLCREHGSRAATGVSSALFGLWHILPALGGGAANAAVVGAVGAGTGGTVARVTGTVLVTALAGVVFCVLRLRSRSLLAPILVHWAINGLGVLFVRVA